jgi:hypothetical protein
MIKESRFDSHWTRKPSLNHSIQTGSRAHLALCWIFSGHYASVKISVMLYLVNTTPIWSDLRWLTHMLLLSVQSQLPGFYDPCVAEEKLLLVHYLFHSHVHEVVIKDNESLRIPKQCEYLISWDCSIYPKKTTQSQVFQQRPKYLHESRLHMKKFLYSRVGTKKITLSCRSPFLSSSKTAEV